MTRTLLLSGKETQAIFLATDDCSIVHFMLALMCLTAEEKAVLSQGFFFLK